MHDEVLAEWFSHEDGYALHVHCEIGRGLGSARFRESIFRQEMPLVLESFRFGDRLLFLENPSLDLAPVLVHFHARKNENDLVESWREIGAYAIHLQARY
jgi:Staygreen protein